MTARGKRTAKSAAARSLIDQDRELLKRLMKEALEEILEAETTGQLRQVFQALVLIELMDSSGPTGKS